MNWDDFIRTPTEVKRRYVEMYREMQEYLCEKVGKWVWIILMGPASAVAPMVYHYWRLGYIPTYDTLAVPLLLIWPWPVLSVLDSYYRKKWIREHGDVETEEWFKFFDKNEALVESMVIDAESAFNKILRDLDELREDLMQLKMYIDREVCK